MNLVHFIELILVLAILVAVGIPLFSKSNNRKLYASPDESAEEYKRLLVRKEETLLAIKELEFDFKTDKLTREDYEDLRKKIELDAVALLEKIDALEKGRKNRKPASKQADVA
ncbi:MAG: hypothetical protein HY580_05655 [Nitrospinae bacterium]|nr:hypothetical protein [Nitrospinota bacterium]